MNRTPSQDEIDSQNQRLAEHREVRVAPDVIANLSRLRPWRSLLRILMEWAGAIGAAVLCGYYFHPVLYVIAVLWIGARQHALVMLLHEGVHYRIAGHRGLNYWISELFLAWPLFITFGGYQRDHFAHHRWLGTDKDPDLHLTQSSDYAFPKSRLAFFWTCLKHTLGWNSVRDYVHYLYVAGFAWRLPWRVHAARSLFYAAAFSALAYTGLLEAYLLYWFLPAMTSLVFFLYFRLVSEHYGLDSDTFMLSRNVYPSLMEKLFFGPVNIHYHLDHHLYPSVPYYNLPKLHAALLEDPAYRTRAWNTTGYLAGVVDECLKTDAACSFPGSEPGTVEPAAK